MVVLAPMGLMAGLTTTVAGAGGGVMLMVALAAWYGDPVRGLAVATLALLVGNLHRAWLYRADFDREIGWRWARWSLVGALVGGFAVLQLPPLAIQLAMVASALAAVANQVLGPRFSLPRKYLGGAGLAVGLASTAGGAGVLANPVLLSAGLRGGTYLSVMSVGSLATHVGRGIALGVGGVLDGPVLADAACLSLAIPLGNALGGRVRDRLGERSLGWVEVGTCALLVGLSVAGLLR